MTKLLGLPTASLLFALSTLALGCEASLERRPLPQDSSKDMSMNEGDLATKPDSAPSADMPPTADMNQPSTECFSLEADFARGIYAQVLKPMCQSCHNPSGIVANNPNAIFLLSSPDQRADYEQNNLDIFRQLAERSVEGEPVLLLKPLGELGHQGGVVLKDTDDAYKALGIAIKRVTSEPQCQSPQTPSPLEGLEMLSPRAHLRRMTFATTGRFPTQQELDALKAGTRTLAQAADELMQEPAFLDTIEEGFNDIFHLEGVEIKAYDLEGRDFPDKEWYKTIVDDTQRSAQSSATNVGIKRQLPELLRHIIKNDLPFTELIAADYVMVNYASAKSYGVLAQVDFGGQEDPMVFAPARIQDQPLERVKTRYAHAGIISTSSYLHYYSTTETNRNRARSRMFYKLFLDTDLLEIAPQGGGDSQAVAQVENPVRDAEQCSVCHAPYVDPVAGAFQNYDKTGKWAPLRDGWYTDSALPGFEATTMPEQEYSRALPWLAQQASKDPRFAKAMVAHAYQIIMGVRPKVLLDTDDVLALKAFTTQQTWLRELERRFIDSGYNIKLVFKEILLSPYFAAIRAKTEQGAASSLYDELGLARLLSPEQLNRKVVALFGDEWITGNNWNALTSNRAFYFLYGGIDSKTLFDRPTELNTLMTSVSMKMANEVACRLGMPDFDLPAPMRRIFPYVTGAETKEEDEAAIRRNIQHLYSHLWGEDVELDSEDVDEVLALFDDIQRDGQAGVLARTYNTYQHTYCSRIGDEKYTYRAWMAVLSYMLEDWTFTHH